MTFDIDEADRQAIILAIAELSHQRPGWDDYLRGISRHFAAEEMYDKFKEFSDVKPFLQTTLAEIRTLRGALEASPHETASLAKERVLRLLDLAEIGIAANEQTEKSVTEK